MKTVLFRTGSGSLPVQTPVVPGSPKISVPVRESVSTVYNSDKKKKKNICSSLHLELNSRSIRRASSESDVIRSAIEGSGVSRTLSKLGSTPLPAIIPEEDCITDDAGDWPLSGIRIDELGFPGGGIGKFGGGGGGGAGGNSDPKKIGAQYKEMLKSDPMNPLLLRNYGKYLHEVERNFAKAEEYYGRAILASPGDGEVLSLYGKLVWESEGDECRAKSYFDQAVQASPDDCTVLGSYARFMWEAEEDDEEVEIERVETMVAAY